MDNLEQTIEKNIFSKLKQSLNRIRRPIIRGLTIALLASGLNLAYSPTSLADIIYLTNGTLNFELKGKIVSQDAEGTKIQTSSGVILIDKSYEIKKIIYEEGGETFLPVPESKIEDLFKSTDEPLESTQPQPKQEQKNYDPSGFGLSIGYFFLSSDYLQKYYGNGMVFGLSYVEKEHKDLFSLYLGADFFYKEGQEIDTCDENLERSILFGLISLGAKVNLSKNSPISPSLLGSLVLHFPKEKVSSISEYHIEESETESKGGAGLSFGGNLGFFISEKTELYLELKYLWLPMTNLENDETENFGGLVFNGGMRF